jgi:hypothetical protein
LHQQDLDLSGWDIKSGKRMLFEPFVQMHYFMAVKRSS